MKTTGHQELAGSYSRSKVIKLAKITRNAHQVIQQKSLLLQQAGKTGPCQFMA